MESRAEEIGVDEWPSEKDMRGQNGEGNSRDARVQDEQTIILRPKLRK